MQADRDRDFLSVVWLFQLEAGEIMDGGAILTQAQYDGELVLRTEGFFL